MTAFTPTEHDRAVGARLRDLRKRRGETMQETIDRSGVKIRQSAYSRTELGDRRLTEIEATALAAHFGTTASQILAPAPTAPALTEQAWLGNDAPRIPVRADAVAEVPAEAKPALFALPAIGFGGVDLNEGFITIDRNKPLTPDEYRAQVWVPYLEARYAADQHQPKAG